MTLDSTRSGQSRRGLLKRAGLVAAGLVGVGAGAGGGLALTRNGSTADELVLHGASWRLQVRDRLPGERLQPGDRGTVFGELLDRPGGQAVGTFHGSRVAVESAPGGAISPDGSLELHTFRLPGGTILGMGSVIGGESVFSIVGGTGRFAGARGSYTADQRLREQGGDGTAQFTLNLIA